MSESDEMKESKTSCQNYGLHDIILKATTTNNGILRKILYIHTHYSSMTTDECYFSLAESFAQKF